MGILGNFFFGSFLCLGILREVVGDASCKLGYCKLLVISLEKGFCIAIGAFVYKFKPLRLKSHEK